MNKFYLCIDCGMSYFEDDLGYKEKKCVDGCGSSNLELLEDKTKHNKSKWSKENIK